MSRTVVIDYGMGNLRSVSKALETLGAEVRVSSDPQEVAAADKLILPGVGAFPAAMTELTRRGLVGPIKSAITAGTLYLGICLGLQLLFEVSDEGGGEQAGFGLLRGRVRRFPVNGAAGLKIPHMGWNQVQRPVSIDERPGGCPLLSGVADGSFFYFVHSYYAEPADRGVVALETDYGGRFVSMVQQGNVYATQFHPEKSQALGLQLLKNFLAL
jgi:glutamine amidotransferase